MAIVCTSCVEEELKINVPVVGLLMTVPDNYHILHARNIRQSQWSYEIKKFEQSIQVDIVWWISNKGEQKIKENV